ncbi:MAG: N-acetyltransferase family protein [Pseudomonadota bacterium]
MADDAQLEVRRRTSALPATAIREGRDRDAEAIASIRNHEIAHTTATWSTTRMTAEAVTLWLEAKREAEIPVIAAGDPLQGFATWGPFRHGEGYAGVAEHSVYVGAAHRGLGLGTALLTALIDRARAAGLRHLVGGIDAGQMASLALHRRQGFVEVGRLPEIGMKFGQPRTLVLMQHALAEGRP